jgi:hypothetical protein
MGIFAFFFIKETRGLKLEDMDILFGRVTAEQRAEDVERTLAVEKKGSMHLEDVDSVTRV